MKTLLLIAVLALSGCGSTPVVQQEQPVVKPETTHLELFVAYRIAADVRQTATAMGKAKRLAPEFAAHINGLADLAVAGLNQARSYYFDGLDEESARVIARVNKVLAEAQLILQHEVKPK